MLAPEGMPRFLVVDSDARSVDAMARLLRDDGHEVRAFTQGARALDALTREPFDAVLTDHALPAVDGKEIVCAALVHAPRACVVVVTADAFTDRLHEAGACIVHEKPVDYDAVISSIDACRARGGPDGTCRGVACR
jgi:DNA-binding NtrC family response regulator